MKNASKIAFIFPILVLLSGICSGQENAPVSDPGMENFLLALMLIFFSVLVGAAIVGIFTGIIFLSCIIALAGLGILSTSVIIGIYRRSITAGFKSFLIILFIIACTFAAISGLFMLNHYMEWGHSYTLLAAVGLAAGILSGFLTGLLSYKIQSLFRRFVMQRFGLNINAVKTEG